MKTPSKDNPAIILGAIMLREFYNAQFESNEDCVRFLQAVFESANYLNLKKELDR